MATAQNADKEKREAVDAKEDTGARDQLAVEIFTGLETRSDKENALAVADVSQNTAPAASTSRDAESQQSASPQSTESECLVKENPEAVTEVSTTGEGQLTSMASIQDIKKKIPGLADLILPATPASPSYERKSDSTSSSDSDVHDDVSPAIPPLLRRVSISAHGRLKTRLQDPPPLTPAMKNQLTHCSSSLLRRRASLLAVNEQENARPEDVSTSKPSTESNQTSAPIPIASPSGSFNKNSQVPPPIPEEDRDPLDDDIIPASKKKKTQDSKWGIYLQWTILLLLIALLACSIKIKFLNKAMFLSLDIWRWLALTLVVFCGRLISGWIMKLLEMLIEKHYILKKRVLYFVYGLRRAVKNCLWLALVLGVWESIFGGLENITAVHVLTKILWCLFTASISWMVKVLAVKVAANSFHRKAYFDRIQECIFNQYLLEILSGPPTMAGIPDTGSNQDLFKKQWTRSEKKKHKHQPFKDNESGEQKPQKHPAPQMQRSRRLSRQISIDTPGYTTVEVGEFPASSGSDIHTPSRHKVSITNPGPLIARSPIPIEQEKLQELTSDTVSVWTLRRLMKLIRNTNISTYSSIISQEKEEGEISSEVQAKAAAKQVSI
ncbi:hypothetical protein L7F22_029870 [Adiantum nelumboides]|nr:hypothetical protein [Adiantum nelumboides]